MQGLDERSRVQRLIRRLAGGAAVLVLLVITTSAYLRHTQAGLGCTDWPQCYGRVAGPAQRTEPPAAQKYARMLHRVSATLVATLLLALALVCWTQKPLLYKQSGIVAVAILVTLFLAVLGASTPGSHLPGVTLGNLGGGFLMFALLGWLRATTDAPEVQPTWLRLGVFVGLLLLTAQIALGGMIGAEFGALSCTGFPGCEGAGRVEVMVLAQLDPFRELAVGPDGRIVAAPALAAVHVVHRLTALLLVGYLTWLAVKVYALGGLWRPRGTAVLLLVVLQAALGVPAVLFSLPLALVLMHNLVAALLLLVLVGMAGRPRRPVLQAGHIK